MWDIDFFSACQLSYSSNLILYMFSKLKRFNRYEFARGFSISRVTIQSYCKHQQNNLAKQYNYSRIYCNRGGLAWTCDGVRLFTYYSSSSCASKSKDPSNKDAWNKNSKTGIKCSAISSRAMLGAKDLVALTAQTACRSATPRCTRTPTSSVRGDRAQRTSVRVPVRPHENPQEPSGAMGT